MAGELKHRTLWENMATGETDFGPEPGNAAQFRDYLPRNVIVIRLYEAYIEQGMSAEDAFFKAAQKYVDSHKPPIKNTS